MIFAIDSIPAILAVTTDTFVVYTSNVFALLGMRALYFLLAGASVQFRYLQPGLAVILAGIAAKMLTADLYEVPVWASPAFIAVVLAVVAALSVRESRRRAAPDTTGSRTPDPAVPVPARNPDAGPAPEYPIVNSSLTGSGPRPKTADRVPVGAPRDPKAPQSRTRTVIRDANGTR